MFTKPKKLLLHLICILKRSETIVNNLDEMKNCLNKQFVKKTLDEPQIFISCFYGRTKIHY